MSAVLALAQQANAMAQAEWKTPDWVPQAIRDGMKAVTDLNLAAAKRNALGDLLGYPREVQKNISLFLDKVLADAEDIARWEAMPPEIRQAFQPRMDEKKSDLQWLEDYLAEIEEPSDTTGSAKEEFTEEQKGDIIKKKKPKLIDYEVLDFGTGEVYHFAEGSRLQNVEVFAGKGTRHIFRKAEKYSKLFGGDPAEWQHAKGFGMVDTPDGERLVEVHWVQCPGVGKFEFFVKEWLD